MGNTLPGAGSSPLARGTPGTDEGGAGTGGLIPARAGNTPYGLTPSGARRAHPRSRGEHIAGGQPAGVIWGSSPLARGTPETGQVAKIRDGLIPARAGNTGTQYQ